MDNDRVLLIDRMKWEVLAKSVLGQLERAVEFWGPGNRCILLPFLDVSSALSQCVLQRFNERLEVRTERSEPAEETYDVFKCCVIDNKLIVFVGSRRLGKISEALEVCRHDAASLSRDLSADIDDPFDEERTFGKLNSSAFASYFF